MARYVDTRTAWEINPEQAAEHWRAAHAALPDVQCPCCGWTVKTDMLRASDGPCEYCESDSPAAPDAPAPAPVQEETMAQYTVRSYDSVFDPICADATFDDYPMAALCAERRSDGGHAHVFVICEHGHSGHCPHGCHDPFAPDTSDFSDIPMPEVTISDEQHAALVARTCNDCPQPATDNGLYCDDCRTMWDVSTQSRCQNLTGPEEHQPAPAPAPVQEETMDAQLPSDCYFFQFNDCEITFKRVPADDPLELTRRAGEPPLYAVFDIFRDGAHVGQATRETLTDDWQVQRYGKGAIPKVVPFLEDAAQLFA